MRVNIRLLWSVTIGMRAWSLWGGKRPRPMPTNLEMQEDKNKNTGEVVVNTA